MVSIILATVLFGGMALVGVHFLFRRVRQFLQWRRDTLVRSWKQLLLILPPLALSLVVFGGPLSAVPQEYPARFGDLQEVTASVDIVREYETHQPTGRSVRISKRYYIYLEGYDSPLYVPDDFQFDQEAFLRWAGPEEVTFLYARTDGRFTVYQIQRGDQVFLDYAWARERLTVTFLTDLLMMLAALLFGLGGSIYLPEFLSPKDRSKRTERILGLIFAALFVVAIIILYGLIESQPQITETSADVFCPLTVTVDEGITVTLPLGWQEGSVSDNGTQWYKARDKVSSCFRMAYYVGGSTGEDWYDAFLADYQARQLEEFIKTPDTSIGPFLEEYTSSASHIPGTNFLVSEGWGTSVNGYKNHLLLVLLPERDCAVVIQSSSKELSWDAMRDYADEWVWPLLGGLESSGYISNPPPADSGTPLESGKSASRFPTSFQSASKISATICSAVKWYLRYCSAAGTRSTNSFFAPKDSTFMSDSP